MILKKVNLSPHNSTQVNYASRWTDQEKSLIKMINHDFLINRMGVARLFGVPDEEAQAAFRHFDCEFCLERGVKFE